MRRDDLARLALSTSLTVFFLAGCSGSSQYGSPVSPVAQPAVQQLTAPSVDPDGSNGMTYLAPIGASTVYGFKRANRSNQAPACTVGPFTSVNGGIGVDQSGNLWVPDQGANPKTVTEYAPNCGAAKTVLTISGDTLPNNVAFDKKGHVYVSDADANSGGPGNILQYTGTTVTATLTDADISTPQGLAVDKGNNVWVSYRDPGSSGTYVAEFIGGKMPAKLFKNISLGFPGCLQFDRKQNLLGTNGNFSSVDIYAPPYTEKAPTTRLVLENGQETDPSMCALGPNQGQLYCTFAFFSAVNVFAYPSGKFQYTYGSGLTGLLPYGIANSPAAKN
jgi:sugar lactone lactonase YvrE